MEDVTLRIDGAQWFAWEGLELRRGLDSFSTVVFDAPFEPDDVRFRETFRPFSFKPIELLVGDELVFTGTLVGVDPMVAPDERRVKVSAYARPAVLEDCTAPASAWPLELNGLRLRSVAEQLAAPFGVEVEMEGDDGAELRRVRLRPEETVHSFLAELARQRGLVINDTAAGALRFWRSRTSAPVAHLREGEAPLEAVGARFSPQGYFSEITGQARGRAGAGGGRHTVANPHLSGVTRPHTFTLEDTDGPDAPAAAEARLGRMFGNALAVTIEMPTWRNPGGALWTPNTMVSLEAPGAMVYRQTEFLIREVTLAQDSSTTHAQIELVLPGAFSGEVPDVLPWMD